LKDDFDPTGILPKRELNKARYALVRPILPDLEAFFKIDVTRGGLAASSVKSVADTPLTFRHGVTELAE
jgi:hypothetical protein